MSSVWIQYNRLKAQVPGCLMLFRYGDFYEIFGADAEQAAPILEIALTSREMGQGNRVPLAGIPYHALDSYLPKLLAAGLKVAIVEQVGQPAKRAANGATSFVIDEPDSTAETGDEAEDAPETGGSGRGILERQIARVVTAGTVVDPALLEDRGNNYLAAVVVEGERAGLAYADASTGEFAACQIAGTRLAGSLYQEIERLRPSEVIIPRLDGRTRFADPPPLPAGAIITRDDAWHFELETAQDALLRHFDITSLEGLGCAGQPLAVQAAGAIVQYLKTAHRTTAIQLADLRVYSVEGFMALDTATRRNLELLQTSRGGTVKGSLLWVLDQTRTSLGGRLLRRWIGQPLLEVAPLRERQDHVAELVESTTRRALLTERLTKIGDLERLITRAGQGFASPRDLLGLRNSLSAVADLRRLANSAPTTKIGHLLASLDPCDEITDLISRAIILDPPSSGEGIIAPGFSAELDDLIESTRHAREYIAGLEATERQATGIRGLKVGYNKVFGYYLEVTHPNRDLVPSHYIRKQTLVGAERYITPELKEYEALVLGAQTKITALEIELLRQVRAEVAGCRERVLRTAATVAELDVFAALAEVAVRDSYTRPKLSDGPEIRIVAGRHPVVERTRGDEPFVPNDLWLSSEAQAPSRPASSSRPRQGVLDPAGEIGDGLAAEPGSSTEGAPTDAESTARQPVAATPSDRVLDGVPVSGRSASSKPSDDAPRPPTDSPPQVILLTGPNMAGKSTYLRQAALITLLAQIGSFVPAQSAEIGLVDRIFTRIGAQDDLGAGQSTFLLEMLETANLLTQSTSRSLLILDEVGRGTSTYDGLAIAQAVVEHIHNHPRLRAKTVFATHYHELTELEKLLPRVRNYRVDVLEEGDRVVFLHKVVAGAADRSYGVHVARLAGIPRGVTRRAEEILKELEDGKPPRGRARRREPEQSWQLTLFAEPNPVIEEIKQLDILSLTPLEALTKLFDLQQKARAEYNTRGPNVRTEPFK